MNPVIKKSFLFFVFTLITSTSYCQVDRYITKENVTRIINTLASDEMMGRSPYNPEHIDKAASFIEKEFKEIGLKPLKGLTGYKQEFKKESVTFQKLEVTINGQHIAKDNMLLISEEADLNYTTGLKVITIAYDSSIKNKTQFIVNKLSSLASLKNDSALLILLTPDFKEAFTTYKGYFKGRSIKSGKSTKIIVVNEQTAVQSYSIKATQKIETIKMANVAGMIAGKTKPEEYVIFSGHYDHFGVRKSTKEDSIYNGANDDASGTTAVIELARYFQKIKKNNRTLIFIAFTAEEIGHFGSSYFSEQLNPDQIIAMFNIEMIGKPSQWGQNAAWITGYERSDFGKILQKNIGDAFQFHPDPHVKFNLFYLSDNAPLARLGVPAHSISTATIYTDQHYHTPDDEIETLEIENIVSTTKAIALSSKSIVEGVDTPKRIDKSKVQ